MKNGLFISLITNDLRQNNELFRWIAGFLPSFREKVFRTGEFGS